ncbi:MAG: hypothetical protein J1E85_09105 [Ruminococcus sp.]|nr:hypothetical protein [Ruminococcus sp.]
MKATNLFVNQKETYIYLERYVNNGSPSGWHKKHTTSYETNPFTGKNSFKLLKFYDEQRHIELIGSNELLEFGFNYAHPDSINSEILKNCGITLEETDFEVSPISGGRTMLIRNHQNNLGYLKLTYDTSRIGRVDRQLTYNHCLSSYETCNAIKKAIDSNQTLSGFGIQLEPAARVSFLDNNQDTYEWGVIYREYSPYPYSNDEVLLVPGFSLFGKDIKNPEDESLIVQFIKESGSDPCEYLLSVLKMIVDCYWEIVISCAFHIECHGQNCFFEVTPDYKIKRFIIKDMDSVDKDIPLARKLGLNTKWKSYPFMCFDESIYYYKIRSSYMYDFKLGEYLLSPLISEVTEHFLLEPEKFESYIRNYVREKYLIKLPHDYFPLDGCWYNCDNSERLAGQKRKYFSHDNPKFR